MGRFGLIREWGYKGGREGDGLRIDVLKMTATKPNKERSEVYSAQHQVSLSCLGFAHPFIVLT
jgi:hypothetical protein